MSACTRCEVEIASSTRHLITDEGALFATLCDPCWKQANEELARIGAFCNRLRAAGYSEEQIGELAQEQYDRGVVALPPPKCA